jgi:(E)-4-hydroxy-3-methylbut-2-enyl-diphosphate synthase
MILSMKASNPKVMIQAYRLLAERMAAEDMHYPLHLGVTEAGDGEDGRIKSAIGIGSLLLDGLGDTIRVSLTEDSVYEIPVARAIADKAMSLWAEGAGPEGPEGSDGVDPHHFSRRETAVVGLGEHCVVGPEQPPRVIVRTAPDGLAGARETFPFPKFQDTPPEGLLIPIGAPADLEPVRAALGSGISPASFLVLELAEGIDPDAIGPLRPAVVLLRRFRAGEADMLLRFAALARRDGHWLACDAAPGDLPSLGRALEAVADDRLIVTYSGRRSGVKAGESGHPLGDYRRLAGALAKLGRKAPIWIRNTAATAVRGDNSFLSKLIEASFLTGGLLCDGIGDLVSVETEPDPARSVRLAYNLLQGAGARSSKTEFVACPSCGRTLFDLQSTTQRIRAQTGHLKGVKIAIMGCIVNGPGEMADADFGYVGGAPGKINLYVGRQCVQYNIPQAEADARLISLIKEHGKWMESAPVPA